MIYRQHIVTDLSITKLEDLYKLRPFLEEGKVKINKSQIARELGKDRRTVDKYLKGFKKSSRKERSSSIDPYYNQIKELLSDENKQVFYYKRVLWQFLTDNTGLQCSESNFRRYISKHPEFDMYFKKRKGTVITKKAPMRFETEVGKQAQLDWKESMNFILKSGEIITINIFVLLLSYSRFRVFRVSLSKNQDILLSFLNDAFETFGGVPKELITDNMKTVMDEPRTAQSKGKVNIKFKQFADDYGFKVKPCIAGRPQTKGKVETPMKLLDEIYAYNGLLDYEELMRLVEKLNNRINAQVHQGTGKIPMLYFQKEKPSLSPLPTEQIRKAYRIITNTSKVNSSSMVTYLANQYSVPPEYIGKQMTLQVYDDHLHVYYNTKLITIHRISTKKLNYLETHYLTISKKTLHTNYVDINQLAQNNLKLIGEIYSND